MNHYPVDEGLFDLTRFRTPNAWSTFFSKQAINVKSWDIYTDVIGASGREFDRLLSVIHLSGDLGRAILNYRRAQRLVPAGGGLFQVWARPNNTICVAGADPWLEDPWTPHEEAQ